MTNATPLTALPAAGLAFEIGAAAPCRTNQTSDAPSTLRLALHPRLDAVEAEWRRFERFADCTPFQTFDWLAAWQRHIGVHEGAQPVIAVAAYADGETAFLLPLVLRPARAARRLCWLGWDVNDYNAPLLARDFSQRITPDGFLAAWNEMRAQMQRDPLLRHDWIELEKMPPTVGGQANPFCALALSEHPSGAYFTLLGGDWNAFYVGKRSSATRRRDRSKRKHLSQFGEIGFKTCADAQEATETLDILMQQKNRLLARKGIADMFARPGWRDFFLEIAAKLPPPDPGARGNTGVGVHVSRVQVGPNCAAANLGIVFRDTYYHVLASYDDGELGRYGPGALHLRELIAYAIGRKLARFDFTIGDEPYKLEWSDARVKLFDYAKAATWRGWAAWGQSALCRPLKRFIKQTPAVWRAVSRARAAVGPLLHPTTAEPRTAAGTAGDHPPRPALACIMGDMDLLRPIASAGIPCAVVTRPGVPSLYSRYARARLTWNDFSEQIEELVPALVRFGMAEPEPPVLFYEEDAQLLMISRFRQELAQAFRFILADARLIEDLVDKARFQALAEREGLPVPPARRFHPAAQAPDALALRFPVILKPLTRLKRWNESLGLHKALAVDDAAALHALWPQLVALDVDLLAQEFIHGAEAQIESYHCYVDSGGGIAGEFTGRKIRTDPPAFGHTTALEITDAADVRAAGRTIAERLGLTGVAKFDFKRDRAGRLHLLEINPRFTLWHHAGALAGVNIPALVYADLTGAPRPPAGRARAGVCWCRPWKDFPAARALNVPLAEWLAWAWRCEAKSSLAWDDPMPLIRASLHRLADTKFAAKGSRTWHEKDESAP